MKYTTVKLLASNFHLWNNHGCGFVGRQQQGQHQVELSTISNGSTRGKKSHAQSRRDDLCTFSGAVDK